MYLQCRSIKKNCLSSTNLVHILVLGTHLTKFKNKQRLPNKASLNRSRSSSDLQTDVIYTCTQITGSRSHRLWWPLFKFSVFRIKQPQYYVIRSIFRYVDFVFRKCALFTNVTPQRYHSQEHRFRDKILILESVFPLLRLVEQKYETMAQPRTGKRWKMFTLFCWFGSVVVYCLLNKFALDRMSSRCWSQSTIN